MKINTTFSKIKFGWMLSSTSLGWILKWKLIFYQFLETLSTVHPMGRIGRESEVSKGILFLASDEASFTTGTILPIDGGRHCTVGNTTPKRN